MSHKKKPAMDELSFFLIAIAFIAAIFMIFLNLHRFIFITWLLIIIAYWRLFSKNKVKRSKENETFIKVNPLIKTTHHDTEHVYLNCYNCTQLLRLHIPKRTGHIKITCPRCNYSFVEKTIRGRLS